MGGAGSHLIEPRPRRHPFLVAAGLVQPAEEGAEAAARRVKIEEAHGAIPTRRERVRHARRHLHPRPRLRPKLVTCGRETHLAFEDIEGLDMPPVEVRGRRRSWFARHLRDPDVVDVREQDHSHVRPVGHQALVADDRVRRGPVLVRRWRMLIVRKGVPVAQGAHEVGEPLAGRVEVEVADLRIALVPEPVHDERGDTRERPGPHDDGVVFAAEPDRQLTLEDVKEIGVVAMNVQVGALAARTEAGPGRVQPLVIGEDLDRSGASPTNSPPPAARNQDELAYACTPLLASIASIP